MKTPSGPDGFKPAVYPYLQNGGGTDVAVIRFERSRTGMRAPAHVSPLVP